MRLARSDELAIGAKDSLIVRNGRERIVEMVKKSLPLAVLRRLAKTHFMVFESSPANEKNVFFDPGEHEVVRLRGSWTVGG